jgi:hypothetical protein
MPTKGERSEIGRMLQSLRKRSRRPCAVCGQTMTATVRRRYCSAACKQRRYRERKKASE